MSHDSGVSVRARIVKEFGQAFPASAEAIFAHLHSGSRAPKMLGFSVMALPPSVNHMYVAGGKGCSPGSRRLSMEALSFREAVGWAMKGPIVANKWKPAGAVLALVFMESALWVTKRLTMRDMDLDNRLKALFDAIEVATKVPDCTNWEIHCYKLASRITRTTVYLVDLGDIIEWHK